MNPLDTTLSFASPLFSFASSSLKFRRSLLLILRAARNPYHDRHLNTTLFRNTRDFFIQASKLRQINSINSGLDRILLSTCLTSLAKSLILAMPIDKSSATKIKLDMVIKELSAMESTPRESVVNWHAIFSNHPEWIISSNPHPLVSRGVHFRIRSWVDRLSSSIIFPHYGTKILARHSTDSLDLPFSDVLPMSSIQAEYHYSRTGEEGFGPVEMKQSWRPAHLVPRTYYAQGLSAYHASKYLRNPFNALVDLFRNINRYSRTIPGQIRHDPTNELFIYDLTSFTSLFHEHRSMLLALADEVAEDTVQIYDSRYGLSHCTLGFLIRDYVTQCVSHPSYVTTLYPIEEFVEFQHNVSGFLGVYGNLATCTLGHGILLATVNDSFNDNWCAGDDAGSSTEREKYPVLDATVSRAGYYASEKLFIGSEPGAVALKRSLTISHGYIQLHNSPIFPLLGDVLHPEFYSGRHDSLKIFSSYCTNLVTFINQVRRYGLESDAMSLIPYLQRSIAWFRHYPHKISIDYLHPPLDSHRKYGCYIPIIDSRTFDFDPLDRIADYYYKGTFSRQVCEVAEFDVEKLVVHHSVRCNMTPWLRWSSSMGYVRAVKVMEYFFGESGREVFRNHLLADSSYRFPLYHFSLVDTIPPQHLRHLYEF